MVMSITAKLHKFETKLTLPRWQEKMLTCHASLRESCNAPAGNKPNGFDIVINNVDSSQSDSEASLHFSVDEIAAIGSSTVHVLGLGEHDLEAVLLFDLVSVDSESQTDGNCEEAYKKTHHYALQCIEGDGSKFSDDVDTKSNDGSSTDDDGSIDEGTEKDSSSVGSTSRIAKLGLFEYALRICMLQSREERNHWEISDERIRMFFADPRYVSVPVANVHKATRGGDVPKHTPIQKKKSSIRSPIAPTVSGSRQTSRRLSITEMFYELQVDSPGTGKLGKG